MPKYDLNDVIEANERLKRFAPLLQALFVELGPTRGIIESPLVPANAIKGGRSTSHGLFGNWFIKADHALPVAGSIKARGGIYEVLLHAEILSSKEGLMEAHGDPMQLISPEARRFFSKHRVSVGSTGNLGLSIGIIASALGFQSSVHMSSDAKPWKKAKLRDHNVHIIEHVGDYEFAVAAGRAQAAGDDRTYFIDDENSPHLFLGYSTAALRLKRQLDAAGIQVDSSNPLFVYLPCGVGGAPGGITFGLRHVFGDHVHCFFAEPVESPCMLTRLASMSDTSVSVQQFGLTNRTDADGLAVPRASEFAASIIKSHVSGIFTVLDEMLYEDLYLAERTVAIRIEPSSAAGFRGAEFLSRTDRGQNYLQKHGLITKMGRSTHIIWTTGGALVPVEEYQTYWERGHALHSAIPHEEGV